MQPIDLLFVSFNRLQFTAVAIHHLMRKTNWKLVRHVWFYDDMSTDGATTIIEGAAAEMNRHPGGLNNRFYPRATLIKAPFGGPVAIMDHFLRLTTTDVTRNRWFAKIDSDTCVPHGWLDAAFAIASRDDVDLLGIEAMTTPRHWNRSESPRSWQKNSHIGGIGLMRRSVFDAHGIPKANGRFGFTEWQHQYEQIRKGFIFPALPIVLLDRVPREPFASLTKQYEQNGWQRHWPPYPEASRADWEWIMAPSSEEDFLPAGLKI